LVYASYYFTQRTLVQFSLAFVRVIDGIRKVIQLKLFPCTRKVPSAHEFVQAFVVKECTMLEGIKIKVKLMVILLRQHSLDDFQLF